MLKNKSLRYQITFTFITSLLCTLIGYVLFLLLLWNTEFYQNFSPLANTIYWVVAIIILILFISPTFESLTDPVKSFNQYLKNFENINFTELSKEVNNADLSQLALALNELQIRLQSTVEELRDKNHEITRLNEEQKQEYQNKKDLITSLSHDLKTPLTIIQTTVSAIIDGIFPPEEINQELNNVLLEVENTTKMIQDTIAIFKIDQDINASEFKEFRLIDSINTLTETFKKMIEKYGHVLQINIPYPLAIYGNKEQFQRVLNNLMLNAIIHSPQNSEIYINLHQSNKNNILEIINTGIIIDDKEKNNIFEPFYCLDKSRSKQTEHGNGLGLYIVKQILDKHHFDIGVTNLDNATKFYIIIPNKKGN